ncbi:MAG: DUF1737 domain-containing protein [Anaerolineaceae bacterium]|nr:DUF1737 domain-containing protein [Anaerolineaceae bacterium]
MQYTIIKNSGANPEKVLRNFTLEVNDMIKQGWEPLGGISVVNWGVTIIYTQAMICRDPLGH